MYSNRRYKLTTHDSMPWTKKRAYRRHGDIFAAFGIPAVIIGNILLVKVGKYLIDRKFVNRVLSGEVREDVFVRNMAKMLVDEIDRKVERMEIGSEDERAQQLLRSAILKARSIKDLLAIVPNNKMLLEADRLFTKARAMKRTDSWKFSDDQLENEAESASNKLVEKMKRIVQKIKSAPSAFRSMNGTQKLLAISEAMLHAAWGLQTAKRVGNVADTIKYMRQCAKLSKEMGRIEQAEEINAEANGTTIGAIIGTGLFTSVHVLIHKIMKWARAKAATEGQA